MEEKGKKGLSFLVTDAEHEMIITSKGRVNKSIIYVKPEKDFCEMAGIPKVKRLIFEGGCSIQKDDHIIAYVDIPEGADNRRLGEEEHVSLIEKMSQYHDQRLAAYRITKKEE